MSQIRINNLTNKIGDNGPTIAGICTVSSNAFMIMPSGDSAIRGARSGRMVFSGGYGPSSPYPELNVLDMVNITTTGNAVDFGDLTSARAQPAGCSNSVRGVLAGGYTTPSSPLTPVNTIDYISIGTLGNAQDFGDLSQGSRYNSMGASDSTRAIFGGGQPGNNITLESIEIATKGNTVHFGNTAVRHEQAASLSNSHGGLG